MSDDETDEQRSSLRHIAMERNVDDGTVWHTVEFATRFGTTSSVTLSGADFNSAQKFLDALANAGAFLGTDPKQKKALHAEIAARAGQTRLQGAASLRERARAQRTRSSATWARLAAN